MAKQMVHQSDSSSNLPVRHNNGETPTVMRDTALSAWNPWREFDQLNRWFDDFMNRSFSALSPFAMASPLRAAAPGEGTLTGDLYETPDEIVLFAYCPGARHDAFDIRVGAGSLTIRGERAPLIRGENLRGYGPGFARSEGTFAASYHLPCEVNADQVKATYRDGVLEVHLPKAENARTRSVKVEIQGSNEIPANASS
jgi:Molecular chaperone (small heat shock protein)